MLVDSRALPDGAEIRSDVCIVGAGAAGITIALELDGTGLDVALFESGGLEPDPRTQALYQGTTSEPYASPLDESRFRYFGGSTSRWAGWCRRLDPLDFAARPWVPDSGWPFGPGDLEPHYLRALEICQVDDASIGTGVHSAWPLNPELLNTSRFRLSPPTAFGTVYRDAVASSRNVTAYLNANATALEANESRRSIERMAITTLDGKRFTASSRIYILACGGIENARLILASARGDGIAVGNTRDLVGRYYMDHPALFAGIFEPHADAPSPALYTTPHVANPARETRHTAGFTLAGDVLAREGLLGSVVRFVPRPAFSLNSDWDSPAVASARRFASAIVKRKRLGHSARHINRATGGAVAAARAVFRAAHHTMMPRTLLALRAWVESAPNPENRVTLSRHHNALGPMAHVRWRTGSGEHRALERLLDILDEEVRRRGYGRINSLLSREDSEARFQPGASHHMGTTRMHDSPAHGVVDGNCRVHEVGNLYVAGSSVFPTCGYANPTLTIVALAVRLAEEMKRALAPHGASGFSSFPIEN